MNGLRFEWDEANNRANVRKHGVSFEDAQTVFLDEHAIRYFDPDHSEDEDRFIMPGMRWRLSSIARALLDHETEELYPRFCCKAQHIYSTITQLPV